jgi:hypothetical protein
LAEKIEIERSKRAQGEFCYNFRLSLSINRVRVRAFFGGVDYAKLEFSLVFGSEGLSEMPLS